MTAPVRTPAQAPARPAPDPAPAPAPERARARTRAGVRPRVRASGGSGGGGLLRNGHVLTLSSLLTSGLGAVYWVLATSFYSTETVGRSYAALSVATLLAGIGQLNLADVLVRFAPAAGRHTRWLALRCYAVAALFSVAVSALFLLMVPLVSPELGYLRSPVAAVAFVTATAGYSIFVIQDGLLTGLRRPGWVLAENAVFAAVKAGLLVVCGLLAFNSGILLSWAGALAVALLITNLYLFRRAVPNHVRAGGDAVMPPRLLRYASADCVGSLFRLVAYTVVPLLVLNRLGSTQNAYFSLAWVIGYTLFLAAYNMGSSLVVEAAHAPERLVADARRVLRHSGALLAAAALLLVAVAPWLLRLFGPGYAEHGTTLLRLLALAALPNLLLDVAVDTARARRRLGWAIGLQAVLCVLVLGLSIWLLPVLGITGVGVAWLAAECVLGLPLLITLPRWLRKPEAATESTPEPTTGPRTGPTTGPTPEPTPEPTAGPRPGTATEAVTEPAEPRRTP